MQLTKWLHEPIWLPEVKVIHWPWSKVTQDSTFSNFFFLETTWPIEAKFYVDGGMKVWSTGLGHMTKMAALPIYGKNLKKSSSLEPQGWWPWKLVYSIGYSSTTKFVQMMTLCWPWAILRQGQIWSPIVGHHCPYMVKSLKNLLLWNLKADDMLHWVLKYYQVCSNDASGLTMTYLWQDQIWLKQWIF